MTPSPIQLIIVLIIVLLLFGAKKIPELAKGLGTGMREFRQGASGELSEDKSSDGSESKVDKEAAAKPADNDARSEDDSSETGDTSTAQNADKTEQRS